MAGAVGLVGAEVTVGTLLTAVTKMLKVASEDSCPLESTPFTLKALMVPLAYCAGVQVRVSLMDTVVVPATTAVP